MGKIKQKFELEKDTKTFRRVSSEHPLDIYLGYNERNFPTMIITVIGKSRHVESSKSIEVKLYQKKDKEYSLSFSLIDKDKEVMFYKFCEDMIDSSTRIEYENSISFILNRWDKWRLMFKKSNNKLLSENQIQGLIGELIFLNKYLAPQFGYDIAIKSWMGPELAHKDFELEDTWHEVKSIKQNALTVKISSIQQLESDLEGNLQVIVLDKSNDKVNNSISLNAIVESIQNEIIKLETHLEFLNKLREIGYSVDEEYDNYNYKFIRKVSYRVQEGFPMISSENLKEGIVRVSYDILLKDIEKFIEIGE